jgi:signal transduction histidine kinase
MSNHESLSKLQQELTALRQQLADAQRMAALGELISTTTHEFNNVLMTVINYAKMGLRHKDDATREKSFEKILAAGQRAAKITNVVLANARNRGHDFEPTDLRSLVDDALVLLERELRKYRISVDREFGEVPAVHANPNQIQQVLFNLLINARQAISNGGQIVIKLDHDEQGGAVNLMVRDNGAGIPAEVLPRIFDNRFSTKQGPDETGKGGTGVGLSACRDIVEAHNGKIQVASAVGKGTAFTLKLPVAKSISATAAPIVLGAPAQSSSPKSDAV